MPLLEIIGITPVGRNYTIAIAFMSHEDADTYKWCLEYLKDLLCGAQPEVILTDRELGLLKALPGIFPLSYHMLCLFHINRNVEANATKFIGSNKKHGGLFRNGIWAKLVNSATVEDYHNNYNEMVRRYGGYPKLITYLDETWLIYKDKFVKAYTNNVLHFGNTTTNRVESAHSAAKDWFNSSTGGLDTVHSQIHSGIRCQINEIKVDFSLSMKIRKHNAAYPVLGGLICNVTHKALELLDAEILTPTMQDPGSCTHVLKITHGLPCACEIVHKMLDKDSFFVDDLHPFWSTMAVEEEELPESQSDRASTMKRQIRETALQLEKEDYMTQKIALEYMRNTIYPGTTHLEEPSTIKPKGRPKNNPTKRDKSSWEYFKSKVKSVSGSKDRKTSTGGTPEVRQSKVTGRGSDKSTQESVADPPIPHVEEIDFYRYLPGFVAQDISSYVNVSADGNCGYRCVAEIVYGNENRWNQVRRELIAEIYERYDTYVRMNGDGKEGQDHVVNMIARCTWREGPCPHSKWMAFPELGFVIATKYNAMVVLLSQRGCSTYLPLVGTGELSYMISIALLEAHFVVVRLPVSCPLPRIYPQWMHYRSDNLAHLERFFEPRLSLWTRLSQL